ncbi:Protein of unknown function (DUF2911) [Fodinibius salinus]|uniref:DUF2911 domain-containing protein n=1 Tax=Fodinibius salinus TaxID=860790 RepID=A0A5D3YPI6_9BACT|nr:DUF2911 domain-containing protein [Fodinibius salinus]TYP94089.1 Protein of unknown function (DUF2911) [Fodinibius salinus]
MKSVQTYLKITAFAFLGVMLFTSLGTAQDRGNKKARTSPNASVSQTIGTTQVSITYGRPSVNEREVFGGLEAYGEVWRTGANESTAITFSDDVMIEGKKVEAGTYSLYTIPRKDTWTIILNSKLSWGTQYDKSKDVLRVKVPSKEASHMEQFLISFHNVTNSSAECVLHWKNTKVPFTIEV